MKKTASTTTATSTRQQPSTTHSASTAQTLPHALLQLQRAAGNQATTRYIAQLMPEDEEELQLKADPAQRMPEDEEELQLKADPAAAPRQLVSQYKMPPDVQAKMEAAFDTDFSAVNIHANSSQASDVGALAYAQGNDIHFAQGKFDPHSQSGQELLGHELAHVVQQRQGRVQPTTAVGGLPVNDDPALEREADQLGRQAASLKLDEE